MENARAASGAGEMGAGSPALSRAGDTVARRLNMRSLTAYAVLYLFYALAAYILGQMLMQRLAEAMWWLDAL